MNKDNYYEFENMLNRLCSNLIVLSKGIPIMSYAWSKIDLSHRLVLAKFAIPKVS